MHHIFSLFLMIIIPSGELISVQLDLIPNLFQKSFAYYRIVHFIFKLFTLLIYYNVGTN